MSMGLTTLDTLGYSVIHVNMKDIKKLEKEDFIKCAEKLKLNDLRKLFNFTHINTKTNTYCKAIEGMNCLDCFKIMKNDEHSSRNKNYCMECL